MDTKLNGYGKMNADMRAKRSEEIVKRVSSVLFVEDIPGLMGSAVSPGLASMLAQTPSHVTDMVVKHAIWAAAQGMYNKGDFTPDSEFYGPITEELKRLHGDVAEAALYIFSVAAYRIGRSWNPEPNHAV